MFGMYGTGMQCGITVTLAWQKAGIKRCQHETVYVILVLD